MRNFKDYANTAFKYSVKFQNQRTGEIHHKNISLRISFKELGKQNLNPPFI